ncbi:probable histone H2A variant 3 [Tanacetum coccineum]|uniref:Probable histone H2A variant 3 n=1 Tax=Tanacetum coccineum TaxID=301880 RepID=A0ABQ5CG30_9ASTR
MSSDSNVEYLRANLNIKGMSNSRRTSLSNVDGDTVFQQNQVLRNGGKRWEGIVGWKDVANKDKDKKRPMSRSSRAGLQPAMQQGFESEEESLHDTCSSLSGMKRNSNTLIKGTIAGGGVIPHIHKSLINKTTKELLASIY